MAMNPQASAANISTRLDKTDAMCLAIRALEHTGTEDAAPQCSLGLNPVQYSRTQEGCIFQHVWVLEPARLLQRAASEPLSSNTSPSLGPRPPLHCVPVSLQRCRRWP